MTAQQKAATEPAQEAPPLALQGMSVVAEWLGLSTAALSGGMKRNDGWPRAAGTITPGRKGEDNPDRGWLPDSKDRWLAWHASWPGRGSRTELEAAEDDTVTLECAGHAGVAAWLGILPGALHQAMRRYPDGIPGATITISPGRSRDDGLDKGWAEDKRPEWEAWRALQPGRGGGNHSGPRKARTRQTAVPVRRLDLDAVNRLASDLVRELEEGVLTYDLPYQRGQVWSAGKRMELIRSWLGGVPIQSLVINDRTAAAWTDRTGKPGGDDPLRAVVDGKQRLTTARLWFGNKLAVPATWFPADDVEATVDTDDGPYVTWEGLSRAARRAMESGMAVFTVTTAQVGDLKAEAAMYRRVNGAGSRHTRDDLARAGAVAAGTAR